VLSGGVRKIAIQTPKGNFNVWTRRVGNNPQIKVLLLHGGPGATHEYFEAADSYFPGAGVEYYYYDQLGSAFSDQPDDNSLWDLPRFVEEVEQVRQALGLDRENFYLLGHSWGGILGIEYALKYQSHLKGLIISNMMASVPLYNKYARRSDARNGSASARRDPAVRGGRRYRKPAIHAAAGLELLQPTRSANAAAAVAGSGSARLCQNQPQGVRAHAGPKRDGHR
jgi:pimeloyl-ACP methyl ester carboxylesterase